MFNVYVTQRNTTVQYYKEHNQVSIPLIANKDTYRTKEPLKKPPTMVRTLRFMTIMHP